MRACFIYSTALYAPSVYQKMLSFHLLKGGHWPANETLLYFSPSRTLERGWSEVVTYQSPQFMRTHPQMRGSLFDQLFYPFQNTQTPRYGEASTPTARARRATRHMASTPTHCSPTRVKLDETVNGHAVNAVPGCSVCIISAVHQVMIPC